LINFLDSPGETLERAHLDAHPLTNRI
jgi:hypothetical protein